MDQSHYRDPRKFVPPLLEYIDLSRLPGGASVPEGVRQPLQGQMKTAHDNSDFIVREPVGEYPGMPAHMRTGKKRFLSAGPESDMPGLDTSTEMFVDYYGRRVPCIAFTVYKWGTGTWPVQDAVAKGLQQQLHRPFNPKDILSSGLKDRKGRTVQMFVVPGVSMQEAKKVDWSRVVWSAARSGCLIKDVRPCDRLLRMGSHGANFFDVRITVPGKTRAELEEYMAPRVAWLAEHDYLVPNYFHRQRLGPGQNMQMHGLALLTGDYTPVDSCNPLMSNAEVFLHHLLFQPSQRDSNKVRQLRSKMAGQWQFNFEEMERILRREHRSCNLQLEYEVARRLALTDEYGGCAEAVVYDLKSRLSLCVGAWQAYYWNWELQNQIRARRIATTRNANIPLPMSCDDSRRTYQRTQLGQRCLSEMGVIERQAAPAEAYMEAFIAEHWRDFHAEVAKERAKNPSYRPARERLADDYGLSFELVRKMFSSFRAAPVAGIARPDGAALSAALVKRLYLVPRDERGNVKPSAPRRKAFTCAEDFEWSCDDGVVRIRTWLRSGSYFTTLAGALFDTSDPEELDSDSDSDGSK
jgi:tRNA(Glu) U13 pseudouridine synthase TruD